MLFAILLKDVFDENNESSQSEAYKHCYCTFCKSKESEINSDSLQKKEMIRKSNESDGPIRTQNSTEIDSQLNTPEMLSPKSLSHRCVYASYVLQGYTFPNLDDSQESLPSSPFDCTATVMPCQITSCDSDEQLKLTYEHRCFKRSDKGENRQFVIKFQVSHSKLTPQKNDSYWKRNYFFMSWNYFSVLKSFSFLNNSITLTASRHDGYQPKVRRRSFI